MDIEDPGQLAEYLRRRGDLAPGEALACSRLAGGVSNKTVRVARAGGDWVLKQALPKLRVKDDWFSDPSRIHREAEGMRVLADLAPVGVILPYFFEDVQAHVLAMAAAPDPHTVWKADLMQGEVDPDLVDEFGRVLGRIHAGFDTARYPADGILHDRSFFETLRIEPYYQVSASRVPDAAGFIEDLIAETRATAVTVVHGDYSPKNVLVHAGRMILLDHEVIHIGDPAFDVGFALTHLLSKAHHLPAHRDLFVQAAGRFWRGYQEEVRGVAWSGGFEARAVRHTLACLLARVAGRSPLEYLGEAERRRQREAVVSLMASPPDTIPDLITRFTNALPCP